MRRIKPATHDDVAAIEAAIAALRGARDLLRRAGADRASKAAAHAVGSAEGAGRHVRHRLARCAP